MDMSGYALQQGTLLTPLSSGEILIGLIVIIGIILFVLGLIFNK